MATCIADFHVSKCTFTLAGNGLSADFTLASHVLSTESSSAVDEKCTGSICAAGEIMYTRWCR